ncbi:hypothetical protein Tco_0220524, partial [Tanacetum coccineum]
MNSILSVFTILIVISSSAITSTDSPFIIAHKKEHLTDSNLDLKKSR